MLLHDLNFNPFTFNKNDVDAHEHDNRGYKMADIRKMDKRISGLEEYATLTATEEQLSQIQVIDPTTNTIRSTKGLSGDGFYNNVQSDAGDADYRAKPGLGVLAPQGFLRGVGLTYNSGLSSNTTIKGNTVWPTYTEEVADFSQTVATGYENVNQFETAVHIASSLIIPEGDYFTTRRKTDENYVAQSNSSLIPAGTDEITSHGE
jgi:hypothetical protein